MTEPNTAEEIAMSKDKRKDIFYKFGRLVIGASAMTSPSDTEKAVTPVIMLDTAKEERASAICVIIGWWHYAISFNIAVIKEVSDE